MAVSKRKGELVGGGRTAHVYKARAERAEAEVERLREDIEVAEGSIEDLRRMVLCNLPMAVAHIDKHPEIAKNMLGEIRGMVDRWGK